MHAVCYYLPSGNQTWQLKILVLIGIKWKTIYKDGWFCIAMIDCRRVFVNDVLMFVCQYHPTCDVLLQYLFLLMQSLYCHLYVQWIFLVFAYFTSSDFRQLYV